MPSVKRKTLPRISDLDKQSTVSEFHLEKGLNLLLIVSNMLGQQSGFKTEPNIPTYQHSTDFYKSGLEYFQSFIFPLADTYFWPSVTQDQQNTEFSCVHETSDDTQMGSWLCIHIHTPHY